MTLLAALVALQAKPGLARAWSSAAGLGESKLFLTPDGVFTAIMKPKGGPVQTLKGTYAVGPIPSNSRKGNLVHAQTVLFFYDLASLARVGAPKASIDALKKQGKTSELGMKLYYVPEVPLLSDLEKNHFVPTADRAAASKRLLKWHP